MQEGWDGIPRGVHHRLGKAKGFSLGCVQTEMWRMCIRSPVKEEASVHFWRQEQSPECGGLAVQFADESSTVPKGFPLLKRKPSTIFPVCRGLSFKKGSPSIRHSSWASPLCLYLLVSALEQLSPVGRFQCVGEDRPRGSISASCGCWKTTGGSWDMRC